MAPLSAPPLLLLLLQLETDVMNCVQDGDLVADPSATANVQRADPDTDVCDVKSSNRHQIPDVKYNKGRFQLE